MPTLREQDRKSARDAVKELANRNTKLQESISKAEEEISSIKEEIIASKEALGR